MKKISKEKIKNYVIEHKIELCIVGGTAIALGLGFLGYKCIPKIKISKIQTSNITSVPVSKTIIKELPFKELWDNLSGEKLTPSKLGYEVSMSAQKINKRLLEHGLQTRLPCGEYVTTELGEKFGNSIWKVTASGHSFSNIEWDKRVLDVIFTHEELQAIEDMQREFAVILAA